MTIGEAILRVEAVYPNAFIEVTYIGGHNPGRYTIAVKSSPKGKVLSASYPMTDKKSIGLAWKEAEKRLRIA